MTETYCRCSSCGNDLSSASLKRQVKAARPITLPGSILKLFSLIPPLRMEFLKIMVSRKDLTLSQKLYLAAANAAPELHPAVNGMFRIMEKYFPDAWMNAAMDMVVYGILASYFLLKNEKAYEKLRKQYDKENTNIILDVVGEDANTPTQAQNYLDSYEYIMKTFGGKVSVKLSSLVPGAADKEIIKEKLRVIFRLAKKYGVPITVDAEEYFKWCLVTEDAFCEVIQEDEFRDMENVGIALQVYRSNAILSAQRFLRVAEARKHPFTVRVVKGAYWDTENAIAREKGIESPLYQEKEASDTSFNFICRMFLLRRGLIRISPASHNIANIAEVIKMANGDYSDIEFEVLVGMGEPIRRVLSRNGIPVAVYLPMIRQGGVIDEGMQYLFRRITENTEGNSCLLSDPE